MENAGDDGVFVHLPFFKNLFDGERVNDVRLAGLAKLAFVGLGGKLNGALDAGRFLNFWFFIIGHYVIIITYDKSFVDRWQRKPEPGAGRICRVRKWKAGAAGECQKDLEY